MDTDPLFMSSTDYHLQVNSPAIDAGGNLFNPETTDNKGIPRFLDGDSDNNTLIDIGAYEYFSPLEDLDGDGFHNAIEYLATATITDLIFPTIDAGIILSAGSNYPSLAYKYDSRLTPHLDFIIEKSSDLGMNDPWADITMLPVLATEEKGMTRILVRETSPVLPGGKDYYRLRMEPK